MFVELIGTRSGNCAPPAVAALPLGRCLGATEVPPPDISENQIVNQNAQKSYVNIFLQSKLPHYQQLALRAMQDFSLCCYWWLKQNLALRVMVEKLMRQVSEY